MRALFTVMAVCAFGSTVDAAQFSTGVRAGLSLATVSGDVEDEYLTSTPGFTAGIDLHISLSTLLAVETGLSYATKGARWSYDQSDARDDVQARYLELPALLSLRLFRDWTVVPCVYTGAALGVFLGADRSVKIDRTEVYVDEPNEGARNIDVGIVVGGGGEIPLGSGRVRVDVRYCWGLLTVDSSADEYVANRVLSLTLGYLWTHGNGGEL
jgi:hypothetical protein